MSARTRSLLLKALLAMVGTVVGGIVLHFVTTNKGANLGAIVVAHPMHYPPDMPDDPQDDKASPEGLEPRLGKLPDRRPNSAIKVSILNKGRKVGQDVSLILPNHFRVDFMEIERPGGHSTFYKAGGVIAIGDIKPLEEVKILLWSNLDVLDLGLFLKAIALSYSEGVGQVDVHFPMSSRWWKRIDLADVFLLLAVGVALSGLFHAMSLVLSSSKYEKALTASMENESAKSGHEPLSIGEGHRGGRSVRRKRSKDPG